MDARPCLRVRLCRRQHACKLHSRDAATQARDVAEQEAKEYGGTMMLKITCPSPVDILQLHNFIFLHWLLDFSLCSAPTFRCDMLCKWHCGYIYIGCIAYRTRFI